MTRYANLFRTAALIVAVAALPSVAADTYEVDGSHSSVIFKVKHFGVANYYGRFNDVSGSITYDKANPSASKVEITIQAASVDTDNEKRDKHLNSPDFLNAKQFPVITFKSESVKPGKDGALEVKGTLQLHGVKKPLTVQVVPVGEGKDPWGGYRAGFETSFTVQRSDFDITYMLDGLSDEIGMIVSVEGVKK